MNTKRVKKRDKALRTFVILAVSAIVLIPVLLALTSKKEPVQTLSPAETAAAEESRRVEELKAFWNNNAHNLLMTQLSIGQLPYPDLNERCADTLRLVKERTGEPLRFNGLTKYHPMSKDIEASAGVNELTGVAEVTLFVPALRDSFEKLKEKNLPNFREAFEAHVIMFTMHELEHLRVVKTNRKHVDITEESRAWADTCQYVIHPLVNKYGVRIATNLSFYKAWLESSGDTNHLAWQNVMQKMYGRYDGMNEHTLPRNP